MSANISWNSPDIVRDGLVLYLDAGTSNSYNRYSSAGVWRDVNGNNVTGSLINGPTFSSDIASSINFDGVDDYINFGIYTPVTNTINIWLKINSLGNYAIIYGGSDNYSSFSWEWSIFTFSGIFRLRGNPGSLSAISIAQSSIIDSWNNWTMVRDNGSVQCDVYRNGSFFASSSQSSLTNSTLRIAKAGVNYASASLASIQIYNRALSASEVLQNYNATKGRFGL